MTSQILHGTSDRTMNRNYKYAVYTRERDAEGMAFLFYFRGQRARGCPVGIPCWTESARPKDMCQGVPCGYTLLDGVRPSEGHVLRDALWVYLAGQSPPVRRTCVRGCPLGIDLWMILC